MKSTDQGKLAETAVSDLLRSKGYEIIARNWRQPRCEIDIVAKAGRVIYFVEVKFRSSRRQGEGFEYITPAKQSQMRLAAAIWVQQNDYDGDYRLMAASVSGERCENIELIVL